MSTTRYFFWPFLITGLGLALSFVLGWSTTGAFSGALSFLLICSILAALEISLSFDNAIVNANKLQYMTPIWQRRFLTWGIVIAVFGMRIIFPVAIVAIAGKIGPIEAIRLAVADPDAYAHTIEEAHLSITAFGGTFLMMVALSYFIDQEKDVHWFSLLESRLCRWASLQGLSIMFVLLIIMAFTLILPKPDGATFLFAAILGLITFLAVEMLGEVLDAASQTKAAAASGGFGAFMYLEVLDASFSFDGVIGAFALTKNIFLIAIGLGIGAMYVRSMTIMLVEKGTLSQFRYLEHGAFYSILVLSIIMFAQSLFHVHELITGLLGVSFIGLALWSSLRHNRQNSSA